MDSRFAKVDALFSRWDGTQTPGASLAIVQDGKIIYSRGYGMANLEHGIPNRSDTAFYLCSVSKQFAAFCIALCEEEGLLKFDDDIRQYVPEMPRYDAPITIRHLVHHTSGLRDYLGLFFMAGKEDDELITTEDALEMMARQRGLNFPPGEEYLYSNSGYVLLSIIVERASGKSLRQYADEKIFQPLGMTHTHFHDNRRQPVPRRATGYTPSEQGFQIDTPTFEVVGDGGIYTTVEDLFLWDQNFYHNRLGKASPSLLETVQTRGKLNNGEEIFYAFGLGMETYRGLPAVRHGGAYGGYRTELVRFPAQKFSVILLANHSQIEPAQLANRIADIFLAEQFPEPPVARENPATITLPQEALADKTGMYLNERNATVMEIALQEGRLTASYAGFVFPLAALDETHFIAEGTPIDVEITFEHEENNGRRLQARLGSRKPEEFLRVEVFQPTPQEQEETCGQYYSEELQALVRVFLKDGTLWLKNQRHCLPLKPCRRETYLLPQGLLEVQRSDEEEILALVMHAGRIRNVRFMRMR